MSKKPTPKTSSTITANGMKRSNYFMPLAMVDGLNTLAARKGGVAAEHVRKAVGQYLKRHGIPC